ncbi:MAG: hypothetical protein Q7R83_01130 [bacterium]|nr:hypothetical protein [bacterium]
MSSAILTAGWQRWLVGPLTGVISSTSTEITWKVTSDSGVFYLDEVVITRIQDVVYARRDTWTTPTICDRSAGSEGVPQPQAMLGCRAYKDRNNQTVNVRQFTRLCPAVSIGCQAFVDTRNAGNRDAKHISADTFVMEDNPYLPEFGAATTTRPAARYLYLINDPNMRCQAENASCRAFGKPILSPDQQSLDAEKPFETVYYKDDILKYGEALCRPSEIYCDEFEGPNDSKEYFRDPQNHTCDYRTDVKVKDVDGIPPGIYEGWFQQGLDIPCYKNYLESGRSFNITRNGDNQAQQTNKYAGWVGSCEQRYGECSELRDVNDQSDPAHPSGRSYFMINNDELDKQSCTTVDIANGCVLLRNMSDSSRKFNTAATYKAYANNQFKAVSPISCELKNNDAVCGSSHENDANMIVKVAMDRDCAEWLGCKTAETIMDPSTNKYRDLCTSLALCDKSNGSADDVFCAHYVDRSSTSTGTLFSQGAYFDMSRYVNRPIGLGEKDYSSYAVPDTFSIADMKNVLVARDGVRDTIKNPAANFSLDYRLAATAPIPVYVNAGSDSQVVSSDYAVIANDLQPAGLDPDQKLFLCRHLKTGAVGYYLSADLAQARGKKRKNPEQDFFINCYLPLHATTDEYDFQNVSRRFSQKDPTMDVVLQEAYPSPECKAQPEADSPYPASFVTSWDDTKTPSRAMGKIKGYKAASTCEEGEDCVCAYKRLDYASGFMKKFVGLYSSNVAPGICVGGPRDGQSCLPASVYKAPTTESDGAKAAEGSHESEVCGPPEGGGQCQALSSSQIVRGLFGGCLERDVARVIGTDQTQHPCMTWNPTPITVGAKDPIHFVQTAGYFPPENSGQYYCMSPKGTVSYFTVNNTDFPPSVPTVEKYKANVQGVQAVGVEPMCTHKNGDKIYGCNAGNEWFIHYNHDYVSDNHEIPALPPLPGMTDRRGGSSGAGLTGAAPEGTNAYRCENADNPQNPGDIKSGIRLIDSGPTADRSYTETFYRLKWDANRFGETSKDGRMTFIKVDPLLGDDSNIICSFNESWVDGLEGIDSGDGDQLKSQDQKWREKLAKDYNNVMTRGSEKLLKENGNEEKARSVVCPSSILAEGGGDGYKNAKPNELCYVKYWQTGYRDEGQKAFQGFDINTMSIEKQPYLFQWLNWTPRVEKCDSDKSYFAIRAVFETSVRPMGKDEKKDGVDLHPDAVPIEATDLKTIGIKADWKLVGFWVTACGGEAQTESMYIYMQVDINRGEICERLAEVRSKDSNQDAAFTDRVWKQSGYSVPQLGLQYSSRFSPFSSALNVGPAGNDPLFQTGGSMGGFSALTKTTFKEAGAETYFMTGTTDARERLTNLFARIYRIYNWNHDLGQYEAALTECGKQHAAGIDDEFCGLFSRDIVNYGYEAPTDVTLGLYTPSFFNVDTQDYRWISYYTPRPPRIAAPSITECSAPGRCKIQKLDAMTFDTLSEGVIDVPGGQHRADLRFYAWAAHEQMPIRALNVDWGDGNQESFPDARLKNHKPICGSIKECSDPMRGSGIACDTDADCPAGAGTCKELGTCQHAQNVTCRANADCPIVKEMTVEQRKKYADCVRQPPLMSDGKPFDCEKYNTTVQDTCIYRQFFGNSSDACEANFFEFQHLYTCTANSEKILPKCLDSGTNSELRCSRDPGRSCTTDAGCAAGDTCMAGLAPAGGCWSEKDATCRYTPRVLIEDNWGWCTGECRTVLAGDILRDAQVGDPGYEDKSKLPRVLHKYGGCYARAVRGEKDANKIYFNVGNNPAQQNECNGSQFPNGEFTSLRPWIVYPGSLQLRW